MDFFDQLEELNRQVLLSAPMKMWYCARYQTDSLGLEMNDGPTFSDLFDALDAGRNVYDLFGVRDSVVRQRLFQRLAEIINADYEYVRSQWLSRAS